MNNKNTYICNDGYVKVYIPNSDDPMLIDWDDWVKLKQYRWTLNDKGYVHGRVDGKKVVIHRVIMNPSIGYIVDHMHNKKTDNRKSKLRNCTLQENNFNRPVQKNNTSGTPGVSYIKSSGNWKAEIRSNGFYKYLGTFFDYKAAVKARKDAEKLYFGEFAPNL